MLTRIEPARSDSGRVKGHESPAILVRGLSRHYLPPWTLNVTRGVENIVFEVTLGEVMGFQVIAEMVEEQDILVRLKALGVAYAQGFGIQQPHPIEMMAADGAG